MRMRWLLTCGACSLLGGCGMSSARVSVGDAVTIEMHQAESGLTAFEVALGARDQCAAQARTNKVAVVWRDVAARISAC
jgi:hypothetical protein